MDFSYLNYEAAVAQTTLRPEDARVAELIIKEPVIELAKDEAIEKVEEIIENLSKPAEEEPVIKKRSYKGKKEE